MNVVLLPVVVAPFMERLLRKSFLVAGDAANAIVLYNSDPSITPNAHCIHIMIVLYYPASKTL